MSDRTLTVAEAAQALGVSEKAVRRRIERKVLPSLLVEGKRRIPASALGVEHPASAGAESPVPRLVGPLVRPRESTSPEVLDRLERLARENGQLRMLEEVAGRDREALLEARARIQQLEAQLAGRAPRFRWFGRRATP